MGNSAHAAAVAKSMTHCIQLIFNFTALSGAVRQQLLRFFMRIPITKADWPNAFNATSKYIGRHWPTGKLKLSWARETTAKLLGYNSVHDVQQELLDSIPQLNYGLSTMASSMAVKGVLLFGLSPLESLQFFSSIPWPNLEVWKCTPDYRHQQSGAMGHQMIMDEYHSFMNYATPVLIANAFTRGKIPPFEYTINHDGIMFHRSSFEGLLELVQPDESTINECGIELSVEEYFEEKILPLAIGKVEDLIPRLNPNKPEYWLTPENVEVMRCSDGKYLLLNKGLNAFYPGVYAAQDLITTIKKLFMLENISDVETECNIPTEYYGRGPKRFEPFGAHGSFVLDGQVFYWRNKLNDYSAPLCPAFSDYLIQQLKPATALIIPDTVIPHSHLEAINKAITIHSSMMKSTSNGIAALNELGISTVLNELYADTFYGDETLVEEYPFDKCLEDYDDGERAEIERDLKTYSEFCISLGGRVLALMPELRTFYSEMAIGHYFHQRYQDSDDRMDEDNLVEQPFATEAARHDDFFLSLLTDHLCIEFNEYTKGFAFRGVGWLLSAANSNHITTANIKAEFGRLMTLFHMIDNDRKVLEKIASYCSKAPTEPNEKYLNYGSPYKPTVKPLNKNISDLLKHGRKHKATIIKGEQKL